MEHRPSTARPEEFDEFDTFDADFGTTRRRPSPSFGEPTSDERTMGLLAHLLAFAGMVIPFGNILGPLAIYLAKRDESEFIADQAKEALNFNITLTMAAAVSIVLMFVLIGFLTIFAVGIAWVVLPIIAAIKANEGEWYRYPLTLRLVK